MSDKDQQISGETDEEEKDTSLIDIQYVKSSGFRVIHADGAIGGVTPKAFIHFALYNERASLPTRAEQRIGEDGKLQPHEVKKGGQGITRELEVDVLMNLSAAESLRDWLDERIGELRKLMK